MRRERVPRPCNSLRGHRCVPRPCEPHGQRPIFEAVSHARVSWSCASHSHRHAHVNRSCASHCHQTHPCHRSCENRAYILTCTTWLETRPYAMAVRKLGRLLTWPHGRPCAHVLAHVPHTTNRHARVPRQCQNSRIYRLNSKGYPRGHMAIQHGRVSHTA
ncbi:Chaperone DnaJ [Gossypium arboreum]|uniref:Chaperone DnaJ n=1 Tax=Gossypium arboreum TaxID=29729 RepID=A0A0B0P171_GOSAR|nr:Chaperone DnaJ [Gossypium arboreum]